MQIKSLYIALATCLLLSPLCSYSYFYEESSYSANQAESPAR